VLIQASVENERGRHGVVLTTNGNTHSLSISPRVSGFGSIANGGELLCLAMATCYCNDIYREAEKRAIEVIRVDVQAQAEFGDPGAPASRLSYRVTVLARAPERDIRDLILHTDGVAEVQNTLRRGMSVQLESFNAVSIDVP
jgi:organic hydroperoxide reductase OsmC/OhrA